MSKTSNITVDITVRFYGVANSRGFLKACEE